MARNNTAPDPQPAGRAMTPMPAQWFADWSRQQAAVAAETFAVLHRGFEAMRQIQQDAAQEATGRHAGALQALRQPCQPERMLAVQSDLLRRDFEAAARLWQQLADAALETNTELLACTLHLVDTEDVFAAARALHS